MSKSKQHVRKYKIIDVRCGLHQMQRLSKLSRLWETKMLIQPCRLNHENSRFSKMIMVSVGVSWEGKTNIHFIDTDRAKVNSQNYIQLLDDSFLCISARWGPLLTHIG